MSNGIKTIDSKTVNILLIIGTPSIFIDNKLYTVYIKKSYAECIETESL